MTSTSIDQLYRRVTDLEIKAVPLGISDKTAAEWLGVSVARVASVRAAMPSKQMGRPKPDVVPANDAMALGAGSVHRANAEEGSERLLMAQLRARQLPVPDRGALAILRAAHGLPA